MGNSKINKSNYIWNAIGSCFNAASTIVFLLITTRLLGPFSGGILTIALALAQQMLTVSSFETGTYYVTDGNKKIDLGTHLSAKLFLALLTTTAAVAIALFKYSPYKSVCVILVCLIKILEGVSALFFAVLQQHDRLDIAGKLLSFRTVAAMIVMFVSQLVGKLVGLSTNVNFLVSLVLVLITYLCFILLIEVYYVSRFEKLYFTWKIKKIVSLIFDCLPLFLGTFILTYICNQPKYVIDGLFSEEVQNKFGIVFIPSAVIGMLSFFIYKPLLLPLTNYHKNGERKKFNRIGIKTSLIIAALTVVCLAGAYLLGIPVLSLVYGVDLTGYKGALCIGILGGGFYAVAMLYYNIITIMRKQKTMLVAYVVSYLLCLVIAKPLTVQFGVSGAAASYLVANLFLSVLLILIVVFYNKKEQV